ncbi:MAG: hypothetical protein QXK45_03875 [Thermofilaceae archaeon]
MYSVKIRPITEGEKVVLAEEIPFPGEVPLTRWFSKDSEANQRNLLRALGYQQRGDTWTLEGVRDVADFIAIAPFRLKMEVEVVPPPERLSVHNGRYFHLGPLPEAYLIRVPHEDIIWNLAYYFGQQQVERVPLVWDSEAGVFRARIDTVVTDPGSSALKGKNNTLFGSPLVTYSVVVVERGTKGPIGVYAEHVRGRILYPKIMLETENIAQAAALAVPVINDVLLRHMRAIVELYLSDPEAAARKEPPAWKRALESYGIYADVSVNEVLREALDIVGSREFQAKLQEVGPSLFPKTGHWRSIWDILIDTAKTGLEIIVPKLVYSAILQAISRKTKAALEPGLLASLVLGVPAQAAELPATRPVYDVEAIVRGLTEGGYSQLLPLAFFRSSVDTVFSPEGELTWFIAKDIRRSTPRTPVYGAYALTYEDGRPVVWQLQIPDLADAQLLELVEEWYKRIRETPIEPPAPKPQPKMEAVPASVFSWTVLQAALTTAAAASILRFYRDLVARSDVYYFFSGRSAYLPYFVPSLLTGSPFLGITASQLRNLREAAGDFLQEFENLFRPQLELALHILRDLEPLVEELSVAPGAKPADQVYNALLLTVSCHHAQFLRSLYKPVWDQIPTLYGLAQVTRYLGYYERLKPDVQREYLLNRGRLWALWYTSLFEWEPGRVDWAGDVLERLASYALADLTPDEAKEAVSFAQRVLGSSDIRRHPKLMQGAYMVLKRWAPDLAWSLEEAKDARAMVDANVLYLGRWLTSWVNKNEGLLFEALVKEALRRAAELAPEAPAEQVNYAAVHFATSGIAFLTASALNLRTLEDLRRYFGASEEVERLLFELSDEDLLNITSRLDSLSSEERERLVATIARNLTDSALLQLVPSTSWYADALTAFTNQALQKLSALSPEELGLIGPQMTAERKREFLEKWPEIVREFSDIFLEQVSKKFLEPLAMTVVPGTFDPGWTLEKLLSFEEAIFKEALAKTVSIISARYRQFEPWNTARLQNILLYNLYGWLGYPIDENWVKEHFGEPSPMPPFFGNWGHTEQRLLFRFSIAAGGALWGVISSLLK